MNRRTHAALTLLLAALSFPAAARAQTPDRDRAAAEIESLREQISLRESVLLAPSREDGERYAEFLAGCGDCGLVRLLPREKWDGKLSTRGGGAYYSFARRTHEYGYGSDLSLEQGHFSSGFAGLDYGILAALGDVPLEQVGVGHPSIQFLVSHEPPSAERDIRAQQRAADAGLKSGAAEFKRRVAAAAGVTYALRSVQYHGEKGDGGRDLLVGFRVVRADSDGSMTLLWKILKRYPNPTYRRAPAPAP